MKKSCFKNWVRANKRDLLSRKSTSRTDLINKCNFVDKIPQYKIFEQLVNGNIKISNDIGNRSNCNLILKISGIWETQDRYGLTFKFIKIN